MPRYFFRIRDDIVSDDHEGTELADLRSAREHAVDAARDLVCEAIHEHGGVNLDHCIEVTDETGELLFSVTFREAFTITG